MAAGAADSGWGEVNAAGALAVCPEGEAALGGGGASGGGGLKRGPTNVAQKKRKPTDRTMAKRRFLFSIVRIQAPDRNRPDAKDGILRGEEHHKTNLSKILPRPAFRADTPSRREQNDTAAPTEENQGIDKA